jgi:hypothetical protein
MSLIESSLVGPANFRFRGGSFGSQPKSKAVLASAATLSANLGEFFDLSVGRSRLNRVWE